MAGRTATHHRLQEKWSGLFLCVAILSVSQGGLAFASQEEKVTVQWEELGTLVTGKQVSIALTDGAVLEGRVVRVGLDSLVVDVTETSVEQDYPKGENSIGRSLASVIRLEEVRGRWRAIGGAIGAGSGAVAGALLYSRFENEANPEAGGAIAAGLIAGGLAVGYLSGRSADKRVLVISIRQD